MRRRISDNDARQVLYDGAKKVTEADIQKVVKKADYIQQKVSRHGSLGRVISDVRLMIMLVKDYWGRNYREVPRWTVTAVVAALLYVLSPLDLIPDFIPFTGLLDDATVVSACLFLVEQDLSRYKIWKDGTSAQEEGETD